MKLKKKPAFLIRLLMPSVSDVVLAVIFCLAISSISAYDFWWHLKTGQYIVQTGSIPHQDIFSYTASGFPWITHEWLTEVIFYGFYNMLGLNFLIFLQAFIIIITFAILFKILQNDKTNIFLAVGVTVLTATLCTSIWTIRPHLVTLLLTIIFLYLLHQYKYQNKNYLFILPILMLLWVNLHAGFVVGILLLLIYLCCESIKTYLNWDSEVVMNFRPIRYLGIITGITIFVALINPNTYKIFLFPFHLVGVSKELINEWFSPNFHQEHAYAFMLFLCIISLALSLRKIDLTDLGLFVVFTYMSLYSIRHIPLFAVVVAPILAEHLSGTILRLKQIKITPKYGYFVFRRIRNRLISLNSNVTYLDSIFNKHIFLMILIVFIGVTSVISPQILERVSFKLGIDEKVIPVRAVEFIKENNLSGNMFNLYGWGGYLIWKLWPEHKVFIDGRADMYGEKILREYTKTQNVGTGWNEPLNKYNVNFIFMGKNSRLTQILKESNRWRLIYLDDLAVIFIRNLPRNKEIIDKFRHKKSPAN